MQSSARTFFSAPHFAVAGASSSPQKFGYKIFAWYISRSLSAIPLNPGSSTVTIEGKEYKTYASPKDLPEPTQTALSVITPPKVTAELLKEAKEVGIRAVWLQPGSFTDEELEFAKESWPGAAVGGFEDGTVGGEGWCVLVDGDAAIKGGRKGANI